MVTASQLLSQGRVVVSNVPGQELEVAGPEVDIAVDFDNTLVASKTLGDLVNDLKEKPALAATKKQKLYRNLGTTFKLHIAGGTTCDPARLEQELNTAASSSGYPELKFQARNMQLAAPMLKATSLASGVKVEPYTERHNIPFASACEGRLTVSKIPIDLDYQLLMLKEQGIPNVKPFLSTYWSGYLKDRQHTADGDHQYIVSVIMAGVERFIDAQYVLKQAMEAAAAAAASSSSSSSSAAAAAQPSTCHQRIATRNSRIGHVIPGLLSMDPDGRSLSGCNVQLHGYKGEDVAKGKTFTGATYLNSAHPLPEQKGAVAIAYDDQITQWHPNKIFQTPGIAKVVLVDAACERFDHEAESDNADVFIAALEHAAKLAGLPQDLQLRQVIDSRTLQQRQMDTAAPEQTLAAAAAAVVLPSFTPAEPAAAATAADNPAPASPATASPADPAAGSPMQDDFPGGSPMQDDTPQAAEQGEGAGTLGKQLKKDTPTEVRQEQHRLVKRQAMTAEGGTSSSSQEAGVPSFAAALAVGDSSAAGDLASEGAAAAAASAGGQRLRVGNPTGYELTLQQMLQGNPAAYVEVKEEVEQLQQLGLVHIIIMDEQLEARVTQGKPNLLTTAYIVFDPDVDKVQAAVKGLEQAAAAVVLDELEPVSSWHGTAFAMAWNGRIAERSRGSKVLLMILQKRFVMAPSAEDAAFQCDSSNKKLLNQPPGSWPPADVGSRAAAMSAMVAAYVRWALHDHPRVPQGMKLFGVQPQLQQAADVSSSFRRGVDAAQTGLGGL